MKTITLQQSVGEGTGFKYSLQEKITEDITAAPAGYSVVDIQAAALNHRDVWILKGMYPDIQENSVIGSDAVGIVKSSSEHDKGKRVLINPGYGWEKDERGPEGEFKILGLLPCNGTMAEAVVVASDELVSCPNHLSTAEAAALPLAGLTAFRALFTKAKIMSGDHVLVTGIGGGVALMALQFAVAAGAHVFVSSSDSAKIKHAKKLGAKGGFDYKKDRPLDDLGRLLGENKLSAIIDGAGGPLYTAYPRFMCHGGIIVNYGQTGSIRSGERGVTFSMSHVLKNIDVCGSTMGSRQEFIDMVAFVEKHKIKPIVNKVWSGLSKKNLDNAIHTLEDNKRAGKLVIQITSEIPDILAKTPSSFTKPSSPNRCSL